MKQESTIQNPQIAIIVKQLKDYLWSSYNQYLALYNGQAVHIDGALIKDYFKNSNEFIKFMNEHDDQVFLEYKQVKKYTDNMLRTTIEKEFNVTHISDLSMETRNKKIKEMYERTGASIRQLGRVLGVGKRVIENALKQDR